MNIFKKKAKQNATELRCPAEDCSFTCNDSPSLKRHVEWKHPELTPNNKQ
ncbi:MAG: hypothetical protein JSU58_04175 [Dehalococcoidales bacterium]|nr:MAG: hypothetical protein JSU58_04175 [Dehalococcoidales bacterium]